MRWNGMGWDGMGWDEMEWNGMGWNGMGWCESSPSTQSVEHSCTLEHPVA